MAHSLARRRIFRTMVATAGVLLLLCAVAFAGVVFAWARFAHGLPDLHGWHTSAPDSEFRASDARSTYTFDDYLAQEGKVFSELDVLVQKDWASEPNARFCRYNADSICNPAKLFERNWNRSFVLEAERPIGGALLIHGLSDSPYSLRAMGERLHGAGYTVIWLRVPGHGTCPKALAEASWRDWVAAVRVAMTGLRSRVPAGLPLIMVGYSNGGALCVNHVAESLMDGGKNPSPRPDAMVLISPMIGISPLAEFTELFPAVSKISGEKKLAWSGIDPEIDPFKYSSWPTNASLQAYTLTHHLEESIATLAADGRMKGFPPVLTIQSVADSTVVAHQMIDVLMDRLTPGTGDLVLFDVNRAGWLEDLTNLNFEKHIRPRLTREDLAFTLTLVTNRSPESLDIVARTFRKGQSTQADLGTAWPKGTFSLSHVALPIPPTDQVYGTNEAEKPAIIPLGTLSLRGESGVLALSPTLMLRMRHNPFYKWTEDRVLGWIGERTAK